jgi:hypothetical protein
MPIRRAPILVLGALAGIVALVVGRWYRQRNQQWIEHWSGVAIPPGARDVKMAEDPSFLHSSWIEMHMRLPLTDVADFRVRHQMMAFRIEEPKESYLMQVFPCDLSRLPKPYDDVDAHHRLSRSGAPTNDTDAAMTSIMLDETTGSVWICVRYQD